MSLLAPHLGDGLGKVTVGAELAHSKNYGCKAQAFVSISVTCNNTIEDATAVHDIIHGTVRALVNEDLQAMIHDRDEYTKALGQPQTIELEEGKVHIPPQKTVIIPSQQVPKAKVTPVQEITGKPKIKPPSFRR